jgi:hypothetical protein
MMITRMGGRAKVVKKAVAPAMRKGSFFRSSSIDSCSSLKKPAITFLALVIIVDKDKGRCSALVIELRGKR